MDPIGIGACERATCSVPDRAVALVFIVVISQIDQRPGRSECAGRHPIAWRPFDLPELWFLVAGDHHAWVGSAASSLVWSVRFRLLQRCLKQWVLLQ